jgi:hypothetical protein
MAISASTMGTTGGPPEVVPAAATGVVLKADAGLGPEEMVGTPLGSVMARGDGELPLVAAVAVAGAGVCVAATAGALLGVVMRCVGAGVGLGVGFGVGLGVGGGGGGGPPLTSTSPCITV